MLNEKKVILLDLEMIYFSVAYPDPHHFVKLDPDPDPHQSGKLDPDPRQSEKVEALEGHLKHWRVQIWKKVSVRIRVRIKLKGRIRILIRNTALFDFSVLSGLPVA